MTKDIILLAIESSCDETACAIVKNGNTILSSIVSSQINTHAKFGGVVPEVASRLHVENISFVIDQALKEAGVEYSQITAIAVTQGPGLVGCLHIGLQAAKTLAFIYDKPLLGVNHLAGHIYANNFVAEIKYPCLALVVSGGHTELVLLKAANEFKVLGMSQDDAVGEAYDKVARLLGLGYPGGPIIDKLAQSGADIFPFPKVRVSEKYNFSYSGLKSATLQLLNRLEKHNTSYTVEDIACSFQEAVLKQLIEKADLALCEYEPQQFVLAGGVAANSRLRDLVSTTLRQKYPEIEMIIPPLKYCTDNDAMIGAACYISYQECQINDLSISSDPSM
ncbi:MAG: tRNA (adenosine(37)-N6)-threonylcarbamoyltransferase complex transferase subunit TsaD, partial [Erysipelotrichaceae bacterium]